MLAKLFLIAVSCLATTSALGNGTIETGGYSIVAHVSGSGGAWDYAVVDAPRARLFLAQGGVTALDLKTNTVTTSLVPGRMTHGLAPMGDGTLAVDDSQNKVITIFDGASGQVLSTISTASENRGSGVHALDALVLEPRSGLLVAFNGESGQALLVDVKNSIIVGTVLVDGHPEFAAADGMGKIYVNVNRAKGSDIAAIDIASRKIINRIPLDGCEEATGLAYDAADGLLLSVCDNGIFKALDTRTQSTVASIAVGRGADGVMFDGKRHRAFVASGDDGTLSVIAIRGMRDIARVQTLRTQTGTRLGALDLDSGRLYLPSAKFGPPKPPLPYPTVLPGTFEFLVVAPD
ncbi:MAG TPA: hypothetical protein VGO37_17270 [Steroidobacteraceae bacterium]|jgi:DNA-binding beta-propeller fold protein YncE|nr:hypothetical protein [Steroidobacteraceae bacterium]